jgi:hypothetical protein
VRRVNLQVANSSKQPVSANPTLRPLASLFNQIRYGDNTEDNRTLLSWLGNAGNHGDD